MRRIIAIFILLLGSTASAFAQDPTGELTVVGTAAPISLIWSPDGTRLAAVTNEFVTLIDPTNPSAEAPRIEYANSVVFSPDSSMIFSAGQLWRAEGGVQIADLSDSAIYGVFSTNGSRVMVVDRIRDGGLQATLWSTTTPSEPLMLVGLEDLGFHSASFNADSSLVVFVLEQESSQVVALWDGHAEDLTLIRPRYEVLRHLDFSPDGTQVVTVSGSDAPYGGPLEMVEVWDVSRGNLQKSWPNAISASFTSDGLLVVAGSTVTVWDGTAETSLSLPEQVGYRLVASPDRQNFLITNDDGTQTTLWTTVAVTESAEPIALDIGGSIRSAVFSPDGASLAVHYADDANRGFTILIDVASGETRAGLPLAGALSFNTDGSRLLVSGMPQTASVRVDTGGLDGMMTDTRVVAPDGVATAAWDGGTLELKPINSTDETRITLIDGYLGRIAAHAMPHGLALFHRTSDIVSGGTGTLVNIASGQTLWTSDGLIDLRMATFSGDGQTLVTVQHSKSAEADYVVVWDAVSGARQMAFNVPSRMGDLIVNDSGTVAALRYVPQFERGEIFYGTSVLVRLSDGAILAELVIENYGTTAHTFMPGRPYYALAGNDERILLYNLDELGAPDAIEFGSLAPMQYITRISFSPDQRWLAVSAFVDQTNYTTWVVPVPSPEFLSFDASAVSRITLEAQPPLIWGSGSWLTARTTHPEHWPYAINAETGAVQEIPLADAVQVAVNNRTFAIQAQGQVGLYDFEDDMMQRAIIDAPWQLENIAFSTDQSRLFGYGQSRACAWKLPDGVMP